VAICFVRSALEHLRARGMDAGLVSRQAGISPLLLNCPQARESAGQYGHLSARVRRFLRNSLSTNPIAFVSLAAAMNMTAATIRRRLQAEGTTYQALKDHVRRELAVEYLSDFRRTTTEIGLQLGYSEHSSFHRAFRSWAGVTPGEFRRRLVRNINLSNKDSRQEPTLGI